MIIADSNWDWSDLLNENSGAAAEPNDTFEVATELGELGDVLSVNASIYVVDDVDYYKFTLTENQFVSFVTDGVEDGDTRLTLYDAAGTEITSNDDHDEGLYAKMSTVLTAGTYYVAVEGWDTIEEYSLTISPGEMPVGEPNISFETAVALDMLTGEIQVNSSFFSADDYDYYKITLTEDQFVSFIPADMAAGAYSYLTLYNSSHDEIDSAISSWNQRVERYLAAGTYYVEMSGEDAGEYTFRANVKTFQEVPDTNNILTSAFDLDAITDEGVIVHQVSPDIENYYKFTLAEDKIVMFETPGAKYRDIYISLFDGDEELTSEYSNLTYALTAGTYYVSLAPEVDLEEYYFSVYSVDLPETEFNNTFETAYDLGEITHEFRLSEKFDYNGDWDFFKFTFADDRICALQSSALWGVYDSNGEELQVVVETEEHGRNYYYYSFVAGETYYMEFGLEYVSPRVYSVSVQDICDYDFGVISDNVANEDWNSWYRFTLSESKVLELVTEEDVWFDLYYDTQGEDIESSIGSEIFSLEAGTYYVRMDEFANNGRGANLSINVVELPAGEPNDDIASAVDLGVVSKSFSVSDVLSGDLGYFYDYEDFYKFTLTEEKYVEISVSGLEDKVLLYLYNSDGTDYNDFSSPILSAGTYYIAVEGVHEGEEEEYTLDFVVSAAPSYEPNDDIWEAVWDLGEISDCKSLTSTIYFNDGGFDEDFYRFTLAQDGILLLTGGKELNMLWNASRQLRYSFGDQGAVKLQAGEYILSIRALGETFEYTLSIGYGEDAVTGNHSEETAYDLGTITGNYSLEGLLGVADENGNNETDVYKFTLTETQVVRLSVGNLHLRFNWTGDYLYDGYSDFVGELQAGTYCIFVNGSGKYSLGIEFAENVISGNTSIDSAYDLGNITGDCEFENFVINDGDWSGFYKFTLLADKYVTLKAEDFYLNDFDISLYNSEGEKFIYDSFTSHVIADYLQKGTYYVAVNGSGHASYSLNLLLSNKEAITGNNSIDTAYDLGELSDYCVKSGQFIASGENDYYKFTLKSRETVVITAGDCGITFFDEYGEVVHEGYRGFAGFLGAGTYCFSVFGQGEYSLNVRLEGVEISGEPVDRIPPVAPVAMADITDMTNQDVTVSVTFSEDSVVKQYKIGTSDWVDYSGVFTVSENGTIYFRAEDAAGNESTSELTISNIDKTAPSLEINGNVTEWTNQNITLNAAGSDGVVEYFDGSKWLTGDKLTVSENGTYQFRVTDLAGNVTEKAVVVDKLDKTAPVLPETFTETISGYDVELDWADGSDKAGAGLSGYYIRYGNSTALEGAGVFVTASELQLPNLPVGSYFYQIQTLDKAGNISDWSEVQSFEVKYILEGNADGVNWLDNSGAENFTVNLSKDNLQSNLSIDTTYTAVDFYGLTAGTYQWQVCANGVCYQGNDIISDNATTPQMYVSDGDGKMDVFFGNAVGTWAHGYLAEHQGENGTAETVGLFGKNKIVDVFCGSVDANVLVLTDDSNGDALFIDDMFTAFGSEQARLRQIKEIRAGAGDDIIDMTSSRFSYDGASIAIYGGSGNDIIWGGSKNNLLYGDEGNDRLAGCSGTDLFIGGSGDDFVFCGGGDDLFTFGKDWGNDTIEQLPEGTVTLWFQEGALANWDAVTLTYSDGANSVKVTGVSSEHVLLCFGDEIGEGYFEYYSSIGAFDDAASEKIFEDKNKGLLA